MKLFSYYFRYSQYIPYQRTVQPEIILKNKLYDLTQEQQTNLKQFLQSPTVDQYQLQEVILHQQVCEQIKTLKSLSALKNISFFYLKLKFIDLSFWNTVATQYETIIGKISDITKVKHHMNSFVLLFSQLLRNRLITTEQIPLLKKCSQKTIIKLLPYYQDELLSNLIHAISAIGMFEIEDEKIINKLKSCVEAINISQYQLPEILQLHTSILKTNNLQLIDQSKNHLEDLIVMIKRRFGEVSPTDFGLCLWLSLRYDQPDLCRLLVMNMRELKIEDMSSLLRNAIKFKINLNKYFFFLKALKQQFDEYFQFEENDQKQILLMIKQFITLPFNLSPENQIEILKNKQEYSEYIINHCHAFDQERLSVTIQLANSFDNENQIIDAVTKYIRIQQADQFSIINLLIGLYMYKDQSTLIKEALERLAQLSQQNIPNYTTHYLQAMIIQYYGNTHPDICNQIKVNQNMVQHYLKMSQLEIKKTSEIHQLFFYQSMSEDHLKRYLLNNFEYNLYLLEKQNILKYDKEVKVDNYLVDYRIWDVRKDNLTNIPVQGNLIEFMTLKSFKYSSLVVDYRNDKDCVFIELEGPNHFNENGEQKNRTKIKHDHFKQLNLKVKYLALQEEVEIQECRNLILNLI